jgi:hypothetical protein
MYYFCFGNQKLMFQKLLIIRFFKIFYGVFMKKLHLSLAGIIFLFFLISCNKEDLGTNDATIGKNQLNPKGGVISIIAANPEITYTSKVTIGKGKSSGSYQTIGVMDADGANQTNVYIASTSSELVRNPTWSPDGSSISWIRRINGYSGPSEIVAVDITVNSNGVPEASNYRVIASVPYESPENKWIYSQAWCSIEGTAKIAFVVAYSSGNYLYTVSTSGGDESDWDLLSSIYDPTQAEFYTNLCWSPDDSKIAVIHKNGYGADKILIFDNQTKEFTNEILPPSGVTGSILYLDWSRGNMNTLAFTAGSSEYIYYVTPPTTGTVPTTNSVTGVFPTWSPDNSSLLFYTGAWGRVKAGLKKVTPFTTNVTTISTTFSGFFLNWKR